MTTFIGKSASDQIGLRDEYRLTYTLDGSVLFPDSALNASGVESRLITALPQVGLTVRSVPQAVSGDSVVVIRVQPNDIIQGYTVAQMADRADFSTFDFTLGFNFALGLDITLAKVEYLGQVGQGGLPTGTTPIATDTTAKDAADKANKERDWIDKLADIAKGAGVVILILAAVYVYVKAKE